ncbi:hypothetical protein B0A49_00494 [Cryomyces minteri]|uniref:Sulfhydryl oxidase n=1 Tax=Cryomyces minteri TaxID=331657 RepID=A0A4U0XU39_9PEZI|nr:hypothetical protein B0A49_00494 [Cryomyces minteri]
MPATQTPYPILSYFLCAVVKTTGMPPQPLDATPEQVAKANAIQEQQAADTPKKFPKGVVLGRDGKPCRSCTSFASWAAMTKKTTTSPSTISTSTPPAESTAALNPPADCPPDVDELGRSTWTLLHSMTATYPVSPSTTQQNDVRQFVSLFSRLYPCWVCADDFRNWMKEDGNAPREAATNRINLPEPDAIVEAVVKHIYGFTDSLLSGSPKKFQLAVVQSEDQNLGDLICLARIYFAADKYELPALRHLAGREFVPRLHQASPLSVMTVAAIIYDNTPENDMGLRSETCRYVRLHLTRFMADEPAKTELLNNKSLLQDLLTRLGACMQEYRNTTAKLSSV